VIYEMQQFGLEKDTEDRKEGDYNDITQAELEHYDLAMSDNIYFLFFYLIPSTFKTNFDISTENKNSCFLREYKRIYIILNKTNCHYLLTIMSLQSSMTFLLWNTKEDI